MESLLFIGASQIVTSLGTEEEAVHSGAALALVGDRVAAIGSEPELKLQFPDARKVDCAGRLITPGFVDSHTHAVFGRWRADEYALRTQGLSYMEIARQGGGINASVNDLRARSEDELVELTRPRLQEMLRLGTTTAEVKSGYGLDTETELKMLRVIRRLHQEGPIDLVPTFMGAHEFPPEYRSLRSKYIELLTEEMIPAVADAGLATFCDVFMEPGVFSPLETRRILLAGAEYGLIPKLHADEDESSGGVELAVEIGAASVDNLGEISDEGMRALARSETVATLLPATLFFLGRNDYASGRRLLELGVKVALATDFNPGAAPSPSMPLAMTIACSQMGFDPLEALVAATAGGAQALRLDDGRGTLRVGAPADIVIWDLADYREVPYRFGVNMVSEVWKGGKRVV